MTTAALVHSDAVSVPAAMTVPSGAAQQASSIPCVYCRDPIPASTFTFWSSARRLLSADCPDCRRRVTLASSTWRRWMKEPTA